MPLFHRNEDNSHTSDPARLVATFAVIVAISSSVIAIALRAGLPFIIDVLSPKMSTAVREDCFALSSALVWLLPLNALTNVCILALNAQRRFILAAAVYIIINVVFVVVVLVARPIIGLNSLSIATLAGPLLVLPLLAASLARLGLLRSLRPDFSKKFFVPFWRQSRSILLSFGIGSSLGLLMTMHLIIRGFAGSSGPGSIAALGYAFRLYEVPLSLIANPAAVLMLPNIAILYKAGNTLAIGNVCRSTLLAGLIVLFAAVALTWIGADLIVGVLLQRGSFGPDAAHLTAEALRGFAPAILGEGIVVVFYRVFYSIHKPNRAVIASGAALLGLVTLLLLFGGTAFVAIPLALSGGFLVGALTLVGFLVRDIGVGAVPDYRSMCKWAGCAVVGVAGWRFADHYKTQSNWSELVTGLAFMSCYCVAVFTLFPDYRQMVRNVLRFLTPRL